MFNNLQNMKGVMAPSVELTQQGTQPSAVFFVGPQNLFGFSGTAFIQDQLAIPQEIKKVGRPLIQDGRIIGDIVAGVECQ